MPMALLPILLTSKHSLKTSILSHHFHLIPTISSSSFSSHCRRRLPFCLPSKSPPLAKKVPFTVSAHGKTWKDSYNWMRNTNEPDFLHYLNQENSYAQAFMADTQNLQRTLSEEMRNRMPTKISTASERWGPWFVHFSPSWFCQFCIF